MSSCLWFVYKPFDVDTDIAIGSDLRRILPPDLVKQKVHHVGRLDRDTSGILLLSMDGTVTEALLTSMLIKKTYLARVSKEPTRLQLEQLRTGVQLGDGFACATEASEISQDDRAVGPLFLRANIVPMEPENYFVRLTTTYGRNRVVRRMLAAVGLPVLALHRECIGDLHLPAGASPGATSQVTPSQIDSLLALARPP